jgi:hypothetical protein
LITKERVAELLKADINKQIHVKSRLAKILCPNLVAPLVEQSEKLGILFDIMHMTHMFIDIWPKGVGHAPPTPLLEEPTSPIDETVKSCMYSDIILDQKEDEEITMPTRKEIEEKLIQLKLTIGTLRRMSAEILKDYQYEQGASVWVLFLWRLIQTI